MHAPRLLYEAGASPNATVPVVDHHLETPGVVGDSVLCAEEEGEAGLVPARVPSRQHVGNCVVRGQVCWRYVTSHNFIDFCCKLTCIFKTIKS